MAVNYEIDGLSQSSVYNIENRKSGNSRNLKIYFSTPENDVNEDTGILLLISGFGGSSNSNVYKKMRENFSDEYNLVTVQCDYFGYEFMQDTKKVDFPYISRDELANFFTIDEIEDVYRNGHFDFNEFLRHGSKWDITVNMREQLDDENIDNFNDMGLMQAIDNITAVLYVLNIIYENKLKCNTKKIILYGHSHGAYLGHLCNIFAPNLFSLLIDNSSWLYPEYAFDSNRIITKKIGKLTLKSIFDYKVKTIMDDRQILNLPYLYSKFDNKCKIISYQGTTDNLVMAKDKWRFCRKINNCIYKEIGGDDLDGVAFKSTEHGLDADFLEVFKLTIDRYGKEFNKGSSIYIENEVDITTNKHQYIIDYVNVTPNITII